MLRKRKNNLLDYYKLLAIVTFISLVIFTSNTFAILPELVNDEAINNTYESILANGLKLIVREKHHAPVISIQTWYRVGAAYEHASASGTSHFLEHLMFRGTKNVPEHMFTKLASRNGGRQNAYTTKDATVYYHETNKDDLELVLLLEADRMTNLQITDNIVAKEKNIIIEELLQYDNNPIAKTAELFFMNAHLGSFYQKPVLGWQTDLARMSSKKINRWYKQWYSPDNAVIVIVGDVEYKKVLQLAKKYFGPINHTKYGTIEPRDEIQASGYRQLEIKQPNATPFVFLGYNVPSLHTVEERWEVFALDLTAALLDGGYSARFPKHLIRGQKIATRSNSWYSPFQLNSTLFVLTASPAKGVAIKTLEDKILQQIKLLQDELISEQELNKIKRIAFVNTIYDKDSNFNEAFNIGSLEASYYSWRESVEYINNIKLITPEQIRAVARKYLTLDRLTIARLYAEQ